MKLSRFMSFGALLALPLTAQASLPTDPGFLKLADGRDLKSVKVNGANLSLSRGSGQSMGAAAQALFERIRQDSKTQPGYPVQWVLMDLDNRQVLEQSAEASRKQFGASVSKIFVGGTLMDKQNGAISNSQLSLLASMIVVSSNTAWTELQRQIGDGDSNRGRETIYNFTQRMGYERTRGFQGWWGDMHGNELAPDELAEFLYDTYQNRYPGAEVLWKVMHTGRTGAARAKKYIPSSQIVGSKTGTYDGPTVDPETGLSTGADGKAYKVRVRHQVLVFNSNGRQYALTILADTGSDESAAALAGGLYRAYAQ
jgi:hypothetical protein